jgi:large subunit ribosomal protein L10
MSQQQLVQREKRESYPREKEEMLEHVEVLAKQYNTIIISKLHKVRAGQLMLLRKNFRGKLVMLVAKNKIAQLALEKADIQNSKDFISNLNGQNALIFTNMNPFKLYLSLEKSKVNLPARAGDVATDDIIVPSGNTGIAPGPVLSEFKEAGVQTRIESGSIFVSRDSVVAHPGDVISPKLSGLLSRLNIKPIKAGLSIFLASSEGLLLHQSDISIDLEAYRSDVVNSARQAIEFALEISYPTKESLPLLIAKAFRGAREVSVLSGYITPESAESVLGMAQSEASALLQAAKEKGYKPPE